LILCFTQYHKQKDFREYFHWNKMNFAEGLRGWGHWQDEKSRILGLATASSRALGGTTRVRVVGGNLQQLMNTNQSISRLASWAQGLDERLDTLATQIGSIYAMADKRCD
jgi:hypothetical protein